MIIKTSASLIDAKIYPDSELSDQEYLGGYIINAKNKFVDSYIVTFKPWIIYFITGFRSSIEAKLFISQQRNIILNTRLNGESSLPDADVESIKGEIKKNLKFQRKIKDIQPELFL